MKSAYKQNQFNTNLQVNRKFIRNNPNRYSLEFCGGGSRLAVVLFLTEEEFLQSYFPLF